jgi:hypothetical protein
MSLLNLLTVDYRLLQQADISRRSQYRDHAASDVTITDE